MITLLEYCKDSLLNEYLDTKNLKMDPKNIEVNPEDPNTWQIGDILAGSYGYSMVLPRFFKVIKKSAKQFTCIRLKGKIVSGHRNGQWQEIATDEPYDEKEYKGRINKWGRLKIDDISVQLWNGKPLHGDDLD